MKKRKNKIGRNVILWVAIGVLFIVALYFVFAAGSTSSAQIGPTVKSAVSSSGMVGGC